MADYENNPNEQNEQNGQEGQNNPYGQSGYNANPYGQSGYNANPYGQGNVPPIDPSIYARPQSDGLSIAALVLGIVGIVGTCCSGFGFPFGIAAIVLSLIDRSKRGGKMNGKDIGGLITGIISVVISLVLLIAIVYVISAPEFSEMLNEMLAEAEYDYGIV